MPGKGCQLRKALRRAERAQQAAGDAGELGVAMRPSKIAKLAPEAFASIEAAKEAGALQRVDRVWNEVPALKDLEKEDRQKAMSLCQAMYECVEENGNSPVSISNLGAHYKVQRIKKDPLFHNQRLLDIAQRHLDVFDLVPDGVTKNGWAIRIKEGIRVVNTDTSEQNTFEAALLPDRIEAPSNLEEACQAFRIECIIALYKRGGKVQMNDLGQDKGVISKRAAIGGNNRKLSDLFRAFPPNFALEDLSNGNFNVELLSTDVSDTSMLSSLALMPQNPGNNRKREPPSEVIAAEPGSDREALINNVKAYQRVSTSNKLKWYAFCDTNGSPTYDPSRHPDEFLEEFLTVANAGALPEPDEEQVAEQDRKGAERLAKGKGKGGKSKSIGMGGTWVPGPTACSKGSMKGGKPSSSWGGDAWGGDMSSWGSDDDWDWWSDSSMGMQDAMSAFMMWWGKGNGKGKGKDDPAAMKGGPRVVPRPSSKPGLSIGESSGPWRSPSMGGGFW